MMESSAHSRPGTGSTRLSVFPHARRAASLTVFLVLSAAAIACSDKPATPARTAPVGPAPDSFRVAFETTRGRFVVEVRRAWAPNGADRFYDLVAEHFFDDNAFFRVLPEYIAQFGVNNDRKINDVWEAKKIPDDKVLQKNERGTLTFASDGKDTRTHQLFFNLKDNARNLDGDGFAPIGRVVDGMPVVDSIYSGYGETVNYHLVATLGNSYLKRMFPKIDYIKTATIVP
jgi:peptidyl-prolyl cis-trans isomerase A (cyclophilin A)